LQVPYQKIQEKEGTSSVISAEMAIETTDDYISQPRQKALQGTISKESILDVSVLQSIREMGGAKADIILSNIIQDYLENTPRHLQQIQKAITTANPDLLRQSSHTLGSSSATLGATSFAKSCKQLENLGRSGQVTGAKRQFVQLQIEYEKVKIALTGIIGKQV